MRRSCRGRGNSSAGARRVEIKDDGRSPSSSSSELEYIAKAGEEESSSDGRATTGVGATPFFLLHLSLAAKKKSAPVLFEARRASSPLQQIIPRLNQRSRSDLKITLKILVTARRCFLDDRFAQRLMSFSPSGNEGPLTLVMRASAELLSTKVTKTSRVPSEFAVIRLSIILLRRRREKKG